MGVIDDIKKNAKRTGAKIQGSEATRLEKILNATFYLDKNIDEEVKFLRQVMTRGADTQERVGLHASALIANPKDYCIRKQVLSLLYKQAQGEEISVGLKRIFEEGNAIHEKWQRLFIRAGYSKAEDLDFTRFNERYLISFTPDIVCRIPAFCDEQMVGEIKSVNTYQFQKMGKHPSAWKQLQFYMYLTGIHKGFVLCDDKNTQDFKLEVYDYDKEIVAPFVDRAEEIRYHYSRVLDEGKMVKRPKHAKDPTCRLCETCAMRDACWNIGMGRVRIDNGAWE